jgi:protein-tyrosine phosphatase
MLDLHNHILPGLDDGPEDEGESLALLRGLGELGFDRFVFTPHWFPGRFNLAEEKVAASFERFVRQAQASGLRFTAQLGRECYFDYALLERPLGAPPAFVAGGERYLLVELPIYHQPQHLDDLTAALGRQKIRPILAHSERYLYGIEQPALIETWRAAGFLIQVDLEALLPDVPRRQKIVLKWLERQKIDCFASDIHRRGQLDSLAKALQALRKRVGDAAAADFFQLPGEAR